MAYRCVFTGGGTGGHIYPALAVLNEFKKTYPDSEFLYVGTNGLESKIVPKNSIPFKEIPVKPHSRKSIFNIFTEIKSLVSAVIKAKKLLKEFKPDFVFGTGGYVSAPVTIAAYLLKIPVFLHEQNATPGLTNKLLNFVANKTFISYNIALKKFYRQANVIYTGNPVRSEIINTDRKDAYSFFNFEPDKTTILAFGGSIGAASINNAFSEVLKRLLAQFPQLQVIFITGERDFARYSEELKDILSLNNNLKLFSFLDKMYNAITIADIILCRAGATTIAEITAAGKCSVLIPYPYATDNHQFKNAEALRNNNAAFLIEDSKISDGNTLYELFYNLINDKSKIKSTACNAKKMGIPDAASRIVNEISSLFSGGRN